MAILVWFLFGSSRMPFKGGQIKDMNGNGVANSEVMLTPACFKSYSVWANWRKKKKKLIYIRMHVACSCGVELCLVLNPSIIYKGSYYITGEHFYHISFIWPNVRFQPWW